MRAPRWLSRRGPRSPRVSPAWDIVERGDDGFMIAAPMFELRVPHWEAFPATAAAVLAATRAEQAEWNAELEILFAVAVEPDRDQSFIAVTVPPPGDYPCSATFEPGDLPIREDAATLFARHGWETINASGQRMRLWPVGATLETVSEEVGLVGLAAFDPDLTASWEVGVTVLAPAADRSGDYEIIADATRAVLQRAINDRIGVDQGRTVDRAVLVETCAALGFNPDFVYPREHPDG